MTEQSDPTMASEQFAVYVAIDWADKKHFWALQVQENQARERGEVANSPEAVQAWMNGLMRRFPGKLLAVCLEQARGALLNMLTKYEQLTLFPVHPATVGRLRAAFYPSGVKDDPKDAELLLDILVHHRSHLRRLETDTEPTRQLRFLVEQRRDLVDQKTAQSNRLKSCLKQYYPQVLKWFDDPTVPLVSAFLSRWPTLEMAQKARPATLLDFFHEHNCRNQDLIDQRLQQIRTAVAATHDQAVIESNVLMVHWVLKVAATLGQAIAALDRRIEQLAEAHPDFGVFYSFPGAGAALAPRLIAAFGTRREHFSNACEVQNYSGIAPVKERSGNTEWIHFRWACPKFTRQTFHEWAGHSIGFSEWAKAYYQQQKDKGNDHHAAVRSLAAKWIRIAYRCWKDGKPYNEETYIRALQVHGSPLAAKIGRAAA